MAGYVCDKQYIDFDSLELELDRINSLFLVIFQNFFKYSEEVVQNNHYLLVIDYRTYANMVSIGLDLVADAKNTLAIVRENHETLTEGMNLNE